MDAAPEKHLKQHAANQQGIPIFQHVSLKENKESHPYPAKTQPEIKFKLQPFNTQRNFT